MTAKHTPTPYMESVLNQFWQLIERGVNAGDAQQHVANQAAMDRVMPYADAKALIQMAWSQQP